MAPGLIFASVASGLGIGEGSGAIPTIVFFIIGFGIGEGSGASPPTVFFIVFRESGLLPFLLLDLVITILRDLGFERTLPARFR